MRGRSVTLLLVLSSLGILFCSAGANPDTPRQFVSAREHGDHFHVSVTAANVPTEVLLVRQNGGLRIHPRPDRFD